MCVSIKKIVFYNAPLQYIAFDVDEKHFLNSFSVECGLGSFYDNSSRSCLSCPVGTYQDGTGHLTCKPCTKIGEKQGTTESIGARSVQECKGK